MNNENMNSDENLNLENNSKYELTEEQKNKLKKQKSKRLIEERALPSRRSKQSLEDLKKEIEDKRQEMNKEGRGDDIVKPNREGNGF